MGWPYFGMRGGADAGLAGGEQRGKLHLRAALPERVDGGVVGEEGLAGRVHLQPAQPEVLDAAGHLIDGLLAVLGVDTPEADEAPRVLLDDARRPVVVAEDDADDVELGVELVEALDGAGLGAHAGVAGPPAPRVGGGGGAPGRGG